MAFCKEFLLFAKNLCCIRMATRMGLDSRRELRALVADGSDSPPDYHSVPSLFERSLSADLTYAKNFCCIRMATRMGLEPTTSSVTG